MSTRELNMSVAVETNLTKHEAKFWTSDPLVLRRGTYRISERLIEYTLLQPSPDQWVVMAVVPGTVDASPTLMVTDGGSEAEALRKLERRLRPAGSLSTFSPFVTEWAMHAPER
jgi:hypothetical protein